MLTTLCLSGAVVKNQQNSISTVTYFCGMHRENFAFTFFNSASGILEVQYVLVEIVEKMFIFA